MKILAIESSCDETAVAVLEHSPQKNNLTVRASLISSQIPLHRPYGGVVPEIASRDHAKKIRPLIEQTLKKATLYISEIDLFAATQGPGLAASLLIGHTFAKALSLVNNKPFFGVNHLEAHLLSPFIQSEDSTTGDAIPFPHLGLIVSGGHTMIIEALGIGHYRLIGSTRDDAVGEAFDKVGKMLGLPYPSGPEIEKIARTGNPHRYDFPLPLLKEPGCDFSFSGLKTAVLHTLPKVNPETDLPDLCASFQYAVCSVLGKKIIRAVTQTGHSIITLSGGVSCNLALRSHLARLCKKNRLAFHACPPNLSTDNALMIAFTAHQHHKSNSLRSNPLTENIAPNLLWDIPPHQVHLSAAPYN